MSLDERPNTDVAVHTFAARDTGDLVLTVYRDATLPPTAVVVFFHGGGWAGGARDASHHHVAGLLDEGVVVVTPDYRLTGVAAHPAQLQDAGDAVEWVYAELGERLPLFVSGVSAGGHLASLLGLGAWERLTGRAHRRPIAGAFPFSLVLDARLWASERLYAPLPRAGTFAYRSYQRSGVWPPPTSDLADALLRNGDRPISHVLTAHIEEGATSTPFLIIHGAADTVVSDAESLRLFAALREAGSPASILLVSDFDHDDDRFARVDIHGSVLGFITHYGRESS